MQDLKQKRARIIIADVNDQVARQVLCEAYKLEMTATQVIYYDYKIKYFPQGRSIDP